MALSPIPGNAPRSWIFREITPSRAHRPALPVIPAAGWNRDCDEENREYCREQCLLAPVVILAAPVAGAEPLTAEVSP